MMDLPDENVPEKQRKALFVNGIIYQKYLFLEQNDIKLMQYSYPVCAGLTL